MGFASAWLEKNALFPAFINEAPDEQTGIIVVVPAYNEAGIRILLDSLNDCSRPGCGTEVIIVVNAPPDAPEEAKRNNFLCIKNIESWKKANKRCFFRLFAIDTRDHGIKDWGVGLSRKTGMDEALRRFNAIGNPDGAIVSLDADCTVKRNYFIEIFKNLVENNERKACSVYFEHPLYGDGFPDIIYRNIIQYELHLRYYLQCLLYSGFPYAFHTVGSAMTCKASQYLKAGGMNRKQAGEDFYFIQKMVPMGGYFSLNSTAVYPSPRESFRVPFGTGATMARMMINNEEHLLTYNINSFRELQLLFLNVRDYFHFSRRELNGFHAALPEGLRSFLEVREWEDKITEIQQNTAGVESFRKRFFGWFNMFRIVKYLNYVHAGIYEKEPVTVSGKEFLKLTSQNIESDDPAKMLEIFRHMEKQ
jgi:glycosyltransferase involved in cell wall biosynthesis